MEQHICSLFSNGSRKKNSLYYTLNFSISFRLHQKIKSSPNIFKIKTKLFNSVECVLSSKNKTKTIKRTISDLSENETGHK